MVQSFTDFYLVLPCVSLFYRVLPSFTEFYLVPHSCTEFYRVFTKFYLVLQTFLLNPTQLYGVLPSVA